MITTVAGAAAVASACSAGGGLGTQRRCPNRTYDDGTDMHSHCYYCCSEAIAGEDDGVAVDGEVTAEPAYYPCCRVSRRIRVHPCVSTHFRPPH